jgi:hypothetical protein
MLSYREAVKIVNTMKGTTPSPLPTPLKQRSERLAALDRSNRSWSLEADAIDL